MADPVSIAVNIAIAAATTAISNALAPTQKFEGPRLDDLRIQTSTYGKFRPIPFGTIAYAGNVFWLENNKLKETEHEESTGKGGPKTETTTYTYSATLAVGFGEGEIDGILRIWADNKLIYDARPSADTETLIESAELFSALTIYPGSETQEVNARMEAEDPETPAYRGEAYIVFEDFELETFGNRIPNFTVEVSKGTTSAPTLVEDFSEPSFGSYHNNAYSFDNGLIYWVTDSDVDVADPFNIPVTVSDVSGSVLYTRTYSADIEAAGNVRWTGPVRNVPNNELMIPVVDLTPSSWRHYFTFPQRGTYNEIRPLSDVTFKDKLGYNSSGIRCAFYYDNYIYGILGPTSAAGGGQSPWVFKFTSGGGIAVAEIEVASNTADADFCNWLFVDDSGVYVMVSDASSDNEIVRFDHALTTELNRFDFGVAASGREYFEVSGNRIVTASNTSVSAYTVDFDDDSYALLGTLSISSRDEGRPLSMGSYILYNQGISYRWDDVLTSSSLALSSIVTDLWERSGGVAADIDVTALTDVVDGYAVTSLGSLRSAIEPLQIAYQFDVLESDYKLKFVKRGGSSVVTLTEDDLAAHEYGQERGDELPVERGKESELPRETKVSYISSARDYEPDAESASRLVTESEQVNELNLPIVMSATKAAQVAEIAQTVRWIERSTYPEFALPYKYSYLEPSDVITINLRGITHQIRITQTDLGRPGLLKCSGVAEKTAHYTSTATGNAGQASTQTIGISGPTNLVLLDIPLLRDQDNDSGFYVAAGGYYSGWPGCVVMKSVDGGQSYSQAASIVNESTIGYLTATPTTGDTTVIDTDNTINVKLFNSNTLSSVTEIAMLNGANAAVIGVDGRWVIIKFQTATLEADGTYTLSNIIWGYKGTENNLSSLVSGDTFVLLSSSALIRMPANDNEIGSERHYKGVTFGKNIATATEVAFTNNAESLEPYAPTHITGSRDGSNNLAVDCVRRTRIGGEWRDYVNASLSESTEAYEIDFTVGGTTVTKTGITSFPYDYTASAQTTDFGSPQSSIITNIYQISATTGRGRAGTATL